MIIRNNTSSKRSQHHYSSVNTKIGKTLEKLSSGYRINRASDDAAGLAISEKMRAHITGLGRARKNSQEGINLIQTGEGALQEIHDMLNRAAYLAGESANGTYMDELDRENLQKELDHITSEIDRITSSANFNGIKLFQELGATYERSTTPPDPAAVKFQQELERLKKRQHVVSQQLKAETTQQHARKTVSNSTKQSDKMTLDELAGRTRPDKLNIVYIEDNAVSASQNPGGGSTGTATVKDESGQEWNLNDILEKQIVPNVVNNILQNYPAFSYLKGSSIGIGLEYFHGKGTSQESTLAYVSMGANPSSGKGISLSYTLGVNLDQISTWNEKTRQDLEATIAHEMIHAFMDEATTAGMIGWEANASGTYPANQHGETFPGWFREGMAQTASGPDNWIHPYSDGGLKLTATSTDAEIKAQIQDPNKRLGSDTTASRYGTGYLACMYLGWAIAANGQPSSSSTVDAATISSGINKLLKEVIGGNSLNGAINKLTNGTFSSMADFETKFNSVDNAPALCDFTRGLLGAIGSGRGGLVAGNLAENDLAPNNERTDINLFKLDKEHNTVENIYPDDYPVLSGGTVSKPGVAPTTTTEFGDFLVTGTDLDGVSFSNGVLTVSGDSDVTITMKSGTTSTGNSIVLNGTGNVILDGVNTSGEINISESTQVTVTGVNKTGDLTITGGKNVTFAGGGRLKTGVFAADGADVALDGITLTTGGNLTAGKLDIKNSTVIANDGNGSISGDVTVNGTAVIVGDVTATSASHMAVDIPWGDINDLGALASITIDGVKFDAPIPSGAQNANLWLDASAKHKVTFTNGSISKAMKATATYGTDGVTVTGFTWAEVPIYRPYTVTGGTEGTDYKWEEDSKGMTLVILSSKPLTISKGSLQDDEGNNLIGRIKVQDSIGSVDLRLDGISSKVTDGCAFSLGKNNQVTLTLAGENTFTSGSSYAGISVGTGTTLTIDSNEPGTSNGKLNATGGSRAAGIGSDYDPKLTNAKDVGNSIIINGGYITATGGSAGAGIGSGDHTAFGNIKINGGSIIARGNTNSAGIGGGEKSNILNIEITGCEKIDAYAQAGVGIGTGEGGTGVDIIISGGKNIKAEGGVLAAGIGPDLNAEMHDIIITGGEIVAISGTESAGIGSAHSAHTNSIIISGDDTKIYASGGSNGVGIGTGYDGSTCDLIHIKGGTITAEGAKNSTGIGAGRNSSCTEIVIGDPTNPDSKISVNAYGGMSHDGGNILAYTDPGHKNAGKITISGNNTSVRCGQKGEGRYNTSGVTSDVTDSDGKKLYSYPLYLFGYVDPALELEASKGLHEELGPLTQGKSQGKLPPFTFDQEGNLVDENGKLITITSIQATGADGTTTATWNEDICHFDRTGKLDHYVYLWMTGQDQELEITYTIDGNNEPQSVHLQLKFYEEAGKWRVEVQPPPTIDEEPDYIPEPGSELEPGITPGPGSPNLPDEPEPEPTPPSGRGGIILQIGANYGEILEVPQFYISARALGMLDLSIATQDRALEAIGILRNAINRVSGIRGEYGALQNRLEHNINALDQTRENLSDAESQIRDADMAEESTRLVKLNILQQTSQAMLAQANQLPQGVLQLLE